MTPPSPPVALAHDYLTQRGGAERVVLSLLEAFPGAPVYTSLYHPEGTYPAFRAADVRTLGVNRIPLLRRNHRLCLPVLAPSFSRLRVDADVVVCSSSGWAHGLSARGRKVVYCYTPARWLYQTDRYVRESWSARLALAPLRPLLRRWDRRAATSADRYVTSSTAVRDRIAELYGIAATVVPPPQTIDAGGEQQVVDGMEPGFFLCVSRLLPYKNLDAVIAAFRRLGRHRLVVVGSGPWRHRLESIRSTNTRLIEGVSDAQLRWLYANCAGLLTAAHEDYGLTTLEAAAFAKPSAALRWGGFLDTVVEGRTGVLFDRPEAASVARAVEELAARSWDADALLGHAERYGARRFIGSMQGIVAELLAA